MSGMVFNQLPKLVRHEFDRVLRSKPYIIPKSMLSRVLSLKVYEDLILFSRTVQLAVQSEAAYGDTTSMRTSSHVNEGSRGGARREGGSQAVLDQNWNYHKKVSSQLEIPMRADIGGNCDAVSYSLLTARYSLPTAHCSLLTTHYSLLTTHYSLTNHYSLDTNHYSLLTAHYSLLPAPCSLLTTHYSLTNHYSLDTTYYSLLPTHYSLLSAH